MPILLRNGQELSPVLKAAIPDEWERRCAARWAACSRSSFDAAWAKQLRRWSNPTMSAVLSAAFPAAAAEVIKFASEAAVRVARRNAVRGDLLAMLEDPQRLMAQDTDVLLTHASTFGDDVRWATDDLHAVMDPEDERERWRKACGVCAFLPAAERGALLNQHFPAARVEDALVALSELPQAPSPPVAVVVVAPQLLTKEELNQLTAEEQAWFALAQAGDVRQIGDGYLIKLRRQRPR